MTTYTTYNKHLYIIIGILFLLLVTFLLSSSLAVFEDGSFIWITFGRQLFNGCLSVYCVG